MTGYWALGVIAALSRAYSVLEFSQDVSGEVLFDFTMPRDGLTDARVRVLIPVVFPAVPDEQAPDSFDLMDQATRFKRPQDRPRGERPGSCLR